MSDSQPPDKPEKPEKLVINLDAEPHNADWLRILEQRRQQQTGERADEPELPPTPEQSRRQQEQRQDK